VFVIAVALRQIDLGLRIVMVIPLLIELYALALGISLFLAALFVQFHDVSHLWEVLMNLLFYASGVMFSLTYVLQRLHLAVEVGTTKRPAPHLLWIVQVMAANPIMQTIEDLRHALLTPVAPWTELVVSGHLAAVHQYAALNAAWEVPVPFLIVVLVVTFGALTFRARARNFAENL
jgi:ABC-2 type transport system permease protein